MITLEYPLSLNSIDTIKEYIKKNGQQRYCSEGCYKEARKVRNRESARRWYVKHNNIKNEFNPDPITNVTLMIAIGSIERRGQSIRDIEKEFKRKPGELEERIKQAKKDGTYQRIWDMMQRTQYQFQGERNSHRIIRQRYVR